MNLMKAPLHHLILSDDGTIRTLGLRMEDMQREHEEAIEEAERRADESLQESEEKDDLIRGCHGTLEAILYSDLMDGVSETLSKELYKLLEDLNN